MAVEVLSGVPSSFRSGTTVRFRVGWEDFPASGCTLSFSLRGVSTNLTVSGTAYDSTDFDVVFTAVQTAALAAGVYSWSAKLTETASGDVAVAETGFTEVQPDLSNTTAGTWRTRYEAAATALYNLTSGGLQSVNTEGQSFTYATLSDLQRLVDRLEAKAIEEDKRNGLAPQGNVKRIRMSM